MELVGKDALKLDHTRIGAISSTSTVSFGGKETVFDIMEL